MRVGFVWICMLADIKGLFVPIESIEIVLAPATGNVKLAWKI